ncbi:hypothetical protein [Methanoculleus sediminis]|nr:hypothetical protein [Methanoculleus sediminis]
MTGREYENWIERIFCRSSLSYPVLSVSVSGALAIIFLILSVNVKWFPLNPWTLTELFSMSILVGFQIFGINYILSRAEHAFSKVVVASQNSCDPGHIRSTFKEGVGSAKGYLMTVVPFMALFILIKGVELLQGLTHLFYLQEPTIWSAILDFVNQAVSFINIFLLATMVWILLNTVRTLMTLSNTEYRRSLALDILCIDRLGGLQQLRNYIVTSHVTYSIVIAFLVLSYVNPFSILYETYILLALYALSFYYVISSIGSIRKILRGHLEDQIERINEKYGRQHRKLLDLISEENESDIEHEITRIKISLDTLYTERERLLSLYYQSKGYNPKTVVQFISSFILPIIAIFEKIYLAVDVLFPK